MNSQIRVKWDYAVYMKGVQETNNIFLNVTFPENSLLYIIRVL